MFCGNCGTKSVEGDRFCIRCGREQSPTSTSQSIAAPLLERPEPPAELTNAVKVATNAPPVDRTVSATVTLVKPAEKPLYCRHSPSQRSDLGGYGQDGSEICMGCRLPYAPGSPGSGLHGAAANLTRMSAAPPNHLTWAILSLIFFFWPLGIPAIVYANRVNEKWIAGDITGAQSASRSANDFATWATIVGSIIYFLIIIAALAGSPS
jgi:Interferon-induced transmembrane protein